MKILNALRTWFDAWLSIDRAPRLQPVRHVDISRYMGTWRVIACMDNALERTFVDAAETYRFAGGNRVDVHFEWRPKSFDAPVKVHDFQGRILKDGSNARWKMRLMHPFSVAYVIIYLNADYSLAAVAHPSRKFGWVLARGRNVSQDDYARLMSIFAQQRYDVSKFVRVAQSPPPRALAAAAIQPLH